MAKGGGMASDVCSKCNGTGTETIERMRVEKGPDGKPISVTYANEETCSGCNGFGEFPTLN